MLIREVAERVGLSTDAVRYYEREGLLDDRHVSRRPNAYRDYAEPAVERLLMLVQARRSGMSIAEVKTLAAAFDDGRLTAELQLEFLRGKLAALERRALELDAACRAIATKISALEMRRAAPQT